MLGKKIALLSDCVGPQVQAAIGRLRRGDVVLLENVRFHPEEEKNDPAFAKELAKGFDLYVNDAFGAAHRAHASTAAIATILPAYAGLLMEKELTAQGHRVIGSEGQRGGRWVLLDFGDVVVHVFHQEERGHYDLEGLWADAPRVAI